MKTRLNYLLGASIIYFGTLPIGMLRSNENMKYAKRISFRRIIMKSLGFLLLALTMFAGISLESEAAGGCGKYKHRNARGRCVRNKKVVVVRPARKTCRAGYHRNINNRCVRNKKVIIIKKGKRCPRGQYYSTTYKKCLDNTGW
jgi:hypothetical protein